MLSFQIKDMEFTGCKSPYIGGHLGFSFRILNFIVNLLTMIYLKLGMSRLIGTADFYRPIFGVFKIIGNRPIIFYKSADIRNFFVFLRKITL